MLLTASATAPATIASTMTVPICDASFFFIALIRFFFPSFVYRLALTNCRVKSLFKKLFFAARTCFPARSVL